MPDQDDDRGAAVPTGRVERLLRFGGIASGIAGGVAAGGLRALAQGRRPDMAQLLLTPANTLRLTDGLSHLRGAALKLGQMLSMDTGLVLPEELTAILGRMRDDARHMPPKQLQTVLHLDSVPRQLRPCPHQSEHAGQVRRQQADETQGADHYRGARRHQCTEGQQGETATAQADPETAGCGFAQRQNIQPAMQHQTQATEQHQRDAE